MPHLSPDVFKVLLSFAKIKKGVNERLLVDQARGKLADFYAATLVSKGPAEESTVKRDTAAYSLSRESTRQVKADLSRSTMIAVV